jgi:hypothetical protein
MYTLLRSDFNSCFGRKNCECLEKTVGPEEGEPWEEEKMGAPGDLDDDWGVDIVGSDPPPDPMLTARNECHECVQRIMQGAGHEIGGSSGAVKHRGS